LGGRDPAGRVNPVRPVLNLVRPVWAARTENLVRSVPELVRPVWRLQVDQFGFRARNNAKFNPFGHCVGGWLGESGGVEFARRSPSRAQYEVGRSRSFESQRSYGPWSSFRGFRASPAR
jgi:hypothetical protein